MALRILLVVMFLSTVAFSQTPPVEPGVSLELAKWRAARYSDVRYGLQLTLEKMSPVLKGTMEIRVKVSEPPAATGGGDAAAKRDVPPIILDWRRIKGYEDRSTISNVSVNGRPVVVNPSPPVATGGSDWNEHLVFVEGVRYGENVINLDFTSPILPSGSAITRYVDKEDGSEYIYSLFVPSDASTAFPVFDQPDLKARFSLFLTAPRDWKAITNSGFVLESPPNKDPNRLTNRYTAIETKPISTYVFAFAAGPFERFEAPGGNASVNERSDRAAEVESSPGRPIATLPNGRVSARDAETGGGKPPFRTASSDGVSRRAGGPNNDGENHPVGEAPPPLLRKEGSFVGGSIYVRKSQAAKFKPHVAEVFRLNGEAVKYFEEYFDYKFPFPKYDLVLIPEFPFGGMEHAGATFLRESSIIFPQEPTKNDHINRATLIFHEAAHQWFGDTVTMRWFDDLWLKEGFATFTAYKALERIMPEMNAWKVFYERIKQGAYQTDSTRGTTPIYQEIPNLSAAKSAYGNIVYNKAPAFLRQAEFYLGEDKFRSAVRSFLKKHEFGNAGWEDLVREFETAGWKVYLKDFASKWVTQRGLPVIKVQFDGNWSEWTDRGHTSHSMLSATFRSLPDDEVFWLMNVNALVRYNESAPDGTFKAGLRTEVLELGPSVSYNDPKPKIENAFTEMIGVKTLFSRGSVDFVFPNYGDYGYGIFLLDEKSRDYVLKNIQNERDPFLRSMMWGALWDSVREGELDPRQYVELVVKVLMQKPDREGGFNAQPSSQALANARASANEDESTTALLLSRVGTALNYYIDEPGGNASVNERGDRAGEARSSSGARSPRSPTAASPPDSLRSRVEDMLIAGMRGAETQGLRITYYRAFLNVAGSEKARGVLKEMLANAERGMRNAESKNTQLIPLKTKDRFDIVTRLLILEDPEAPALLAGLEKTETSDEAKRYAYAARAGIATAENKARYWKDFTENKEISESWIEAAFGPWNSIRHSELTLPYLERALKELPNHKRNRKIFFVNGWLGAFIGGQRSEEALAIVNKFLADNPNLDRDLRLKILENLDLIERAVKIRKRFTTGN